MEKSKLKEGGRSVRIVPGPNGIGFYTGDQEKFMGAEGTHNHKNICNENARDVSFSSYFVRSNAEKISNTPLKGNAANNQTNEEAIACIEGGESCCKKVIKDSEISIFEAEKYFSSHEEGKKTDANHESATESFKPRDNSNSKDKIQASKNNVSFSSQDSRNPISSPASFIVVANRSFRSPGRATPTASPEAGWNSQSGPLSRAARNSVNISAANDRKRASGKWAFGCKIWPCSNQKSVEIDKTVTEFRRAQSESNALNSTALMDNPLSSIRYSYPSLGKRILRRSIEKQRSEGGFVDTASEISDFNRGASATTLINPLTISIDRKHQNKLHRNNAKYDRDSDQADLGERPNQRRIAGSSFEKDGFSFPVLPVKSQEKARPSLDFEVFGCPFPGSTHSEETR